MLMTEEVTVAAVPGYLPLGLFYSSGQSSRISFDPDSALPFSALLPSPILVVLLICLYWAAAVTGSLM
jgi:hypothetical protein